MKVTVSVMLILFALGMKSTDLLKIRAAFYRAAQDEGEANRFLLTMEGLQEQSPVLTGYKGMAYFMASRYALGPFAKLAYFRKGKALLEQAIAEAPQDAELRFLRFTVQKSVPSILAYSDDTAEDERLIRSSMQKMNDPDLKKRIVDYLNSTN